MHGDNLNDVNSVASLVFSVDKSCSLVQVNTVFVIIYHPKQ